MRRLLSIDLLKALAIVGVIVNHWMSAELRHGSFAAFHVMQAVPVFFILMGYNAKHSFDRREDNLPPLASTHPGYLSVRLRRLLVPFAITATVGIGWAHLADVPLALSPQALLLRLPFGFPGNFFVATSVFLVALAPALYRAYRKYPRLTVAVCITLSLAYEFLAPFKFEPAMYYVYQVNPLRFIGLFALGFWLGDDDAPFSRHNWFVTPWAIGSAAVLGAYHLGFRTAFFGPEYMYNIATAGWSMLLTAMGLRLLPKSSTSSTLNAAGTIGTASYHIFLMQGLWFGLMSATLINARPTWLVVSIAVCLGVGVAWYRLECSLARMRPAAARRN